MLNLHERWLLRRVRLTGRARAAMLAVLEPAPGDIDVTAQLGEYKLVKRKVQADLPHWFDRLSDPLQPSVAHVVYGHRRYRRQVVLAAALAQAGVSPAGYEQRRQRGATRLSDFTSAE